MLYIIPWAVLIVAVIVAVPVAAKMSPSPTYADRGNGDEAEQPADAAEEEQSVLVDDFGEEPVEAIGDDAFGEFN